MPISRSKPEPLYYQLKNELLKDIKQAKLAQDQKVPSENEMARSYKVSLITVRKALSDLVQEGILYRIQGKGTFVAAPKINRIVNLMSFTDEMKQKGILPTTQLVRFSMESVDDDVARILQLGEDRKAWYFERLRFGNDEPMAIQRTYLPVALFPGFNEDMLSANPSLYRVLREHYSLQPFEAEEEYNSVLVSDKRHAELLAVKPGNCAFLVKRTTYSEDGVPFEYTVSMLRGDRYSIRVKLKSESPQD